MNWTVAKTGITITLFCMNVNNELSVDSQNVTFISQIWHFKNIHSNKDQHLLFLNVTLGPCATIRHCIDTLVKPFSVFSLSLKQFEALLSSTTSTKRFNLIQSITLLSLDALHRRAFCLLLRLIYIYMLWLTWTPVHWPHSRNTTKAAGIYRASMPSSFVVTRY